MLGSVFCIALPHLWELPFDGCAAKFPFRAVHLTHSVVAGQMSLEQVCAKSHSSPQIVEP